MQPEAAVTDREVEQLAAEAKAFAKKEGKDRIAGYAAYPASPQGLVILAGGHD